MVPVGEDQVPHIEMTREIARRFNHVFGAEPDFEAKAKAAVRKLGVNAKRFAELRACYQQEGGADLLLQARALIDTASDLPLQDRERLFGYAEGAHRVILAEPAALLTKVSKMPGLDGQKMSKSYSNTIALREEPEAVTKKIRTMPTDPARVRRSDPGEPERCPVWQLHLVYSDEATKQWVQTGCRTAGIGCLECKQPVIDAIVRELAPLRERAQHYLDDPKLVRDIVTEGCVRARAMAGETMREVRQAMGLVRDR
jgi:tryptophanyl-tRNA synthetase